MMNKRTRIVIVGLGLVGKRHAEAIRQVPEAELVGIVDTSDSALQYANEQSLAFTRELADVFELCKPDGVILATPTPLHVEQGTLCVQHSCPVLIEKPLATIASDAEKLLSMAQSVNVAIMVGHHRRFNPLIQKARRLIDEDLLGEIRSVQAQCWLYKPDHYFTEAPWRTRLGAGPVSVNLVHDIDLLRYLCGEVISVAAQMAPSSRGFENEEVAAAVLKFHNNAVGTISVSDGIVAPWSWELTAREYPVYPTTQQSCYQIGGTRGSLSVPDLTLWHQDGGGDWWKPINTTSFHCEVSDPLINQISHFVRVIEQHEEPLVSGLEGLKTLRVLEAMQQAAMTGNTISIAPVE